MFLTLCHKLNSVRLSVLVMLVRVLLHMILAPFAQEKPYAQPDNVGYLSTITLPKLGAIAFRRMNGSLQYRW